MKHFFSQNSFAMFFLTSPSINIQILIKHRTDAIERNDTTDSRIVSKTTFLDFAFIKYSYISIHMTRQNFFL